jgi:hypothetical protein
VNPCYPSFLLHTHSNYVSGISRGLTEEMAYKPIVEGDVQFDHWVDSTRNSTKPDCLTSFRYLIRWLPTPLHLCLKNPPPKIMNAFQWMAPDNHKRGLNPMCFLTWYPGENGLLLYSKPRNHESESMSINICSFHHHGMATENQLFTWQLYNI